MTEKQWRDKVAKHLVGRTIVDVFYLVPKEADDMMWTSRPIVLRLDNDKFLFPMMDDEGNDGGALATTIEELTVIPVMR